MSRKEFVDFYTHVRDHFTEGVVNYFTEDFCGVLACRWFGDQIDMDCWSLEELRDHARGEVCQLLRVMNPFLYDYCVMVQMRDDIKKIR